ncbi:MAG TPA: DMT family transporter [Acetobacteraceae bacterium]|jgi:probable blue pigment (indigoidine) exporter|nr:DMT family transporter [Acetobacteraceae bacterium]
MNGAISIATAERRFAAMLPGITAALSFSAADVFGKIVFNDGMDVLSFVTTRGVLTVMFFWVWLRVAPPARRHTRRERLVSIGIGVMFAANIFGLLLAIQLLPLSIAILTYFIYLLLTGLAGAATGIDRVGWRGFLAALAAFIGLAMMLGARLGDVELVGVASALAAAVLRVVSLLITRASLHNTDSRLNTWYSLVPSAAIFVAFSVLTQTSNPPQSTFGWVAFVGMSVTSTISVLTIFISIARVGAFRTALIMNLEPLVSTLASVAFLGEDLRPVQACGGALMLVALCAFQLRR